MDFQIETSKEKETVQLNRISWSDWKIKFYIMFKLGNFSSTLSINY